MISETTSPVPFDHAIDNDHFPPPFQPGFDPIFVVLTPPGISSDRNVEGYNFVGAYVGDPIDPSDYRSYWDEWIGDRNPATTDPKNQLLDLDAYTNLLSHESTEQMASPTGPGIQFSIGPVQINIDPSTRVSHGAEFPDKGSGEEQISDLEPDDMSYTYRVNNVLVQAYWSLNDQGFVVPDGNHQQFELLPHSHNYGPDGEDLGVSANYISGETAYVGSTLVINGDQDEFPIGNGHLGGQGDIITIDTAPDPNSQMGVKVTVDGETVQFDHGAITDIIVNPGLGTNGVNVRNTLADVPVTINDTGSDLITIGGNGILSGIAGQVTVNGSGNTTLNIDGHNDRGGSIMVTGSTVRALSAAVIGYKNVNNLTIEGGTASGKNTFTVGDASSNLDNLPALIDLQGSGPPVDSLTVDDGGPSGFEEDATFLITDGAVTRQSRGYNPATGATSFSTSIDYHSITSLTVVGGADRANTFDVGDGKKNLNDFPGHLGIRGGGLGDSLKINDLGLADPDVGFDQGTIFSISAGNLTRDDQADMTNATTRIFETSIDYGSIADLSVLGGNNHFNTFYVGNGKNNLDFLPGHLSIQGGNNGNSLRVYDSGPPTPGPELVLADVGTTFSITAGNVSRSDQAEVLIGSLPYFTSLATSIDYSSIAALTIIAGRDHPSAFSIGDGKDDLDDLPAQVSIQGIGAADLLTVDDSGVQPSIFGTSFYSPISTQYGISSRHLTRTALLSKIGGQSSDPSLLSVSSTINYAGVGRLTIAGGLIGAHVYSVDSTAAGTPVTINTGSGDATVEVTPTGKDLKGLGSNLVVQAAPNSRGTTVTIDNSDGASPSGPTLPPPGDRYVIGPSSTTFGDPITVSYANVSAVTLLGGSSGHYAVEGIPPGATYTLDPGVGPNTFDVALGLQGLVLNGLATGPLTIDDSTDTGDATYTITPTTIQVNGLPSSIYTGTPSLIVEGGSGRDTFNVQGTAAETPVTLMTGTGANLVDVGAGAEDLSLIQGDLTLHGRGQTIAVLDDQSDIDPIFFGLPDIYLVTASTVENLLSATIHYSGLAGLILNGDTLDDPYDVESTAAGTPVTLNLGPGSNSVTVATYSKTLASLKAALVIHSSHASPAGVTVYDGADAGKAAYTITGSTVQAGGSSPITYAGAASLAVEGGSGADTFDVQGTAAASPVTLDTGAGTNTVVVASLGHDLDAIQGPVTVDAHAGATAVVVDDQATAGAGPGRSRKGSLPRRPPRARAAPACKSRSRTSPA